MDHRPLASPKKFEEGSLKRQVMILRQRKYRQVVKVQRDVHGAHLHPVL